MDAVPKYVYKTLASRKQELLQHPIAVVQLKQTGESASKCGFDDWNHQQEAEPPKFTGSYYQKRAAQCHEKTQPHFCIFLRRDLIIHSRIDMCIEISREIQEQIRNFLSHHPSHFQSFTIRCAYANDSKEVQTKLTSMRDCLQKNTCL